VLVGKGTRIAEYLVDWDKEYRAVLRLGITTDTQDATGTVLERRATESVTAADVQEAVRRFRGTIEQLPPMYSAVKVAGVPLYKSARAGKTIERQVRSVVVHELDVLGMMGSDVGLRVWCSKGTYIRTLCADIGTALGVGGHMLSLERTRVGPWRLDHAMTVQDIATRLAIGTLGERLVSMDQALEWMPAVTVDHETAARVLHGVPIPRTCADRGGALESRDGLMGKPVRIHSSDGILLAIGRYPVQGGAAIAIEKVLKNQE
jgi:tRNA pseudouridine55 synthase